MASENQSSFFDTINDNGYSKKFWDRFCSQHFETDQIIGKLSCHQVDLNSKIVKPISLQFGEETLYYDEKGKLSGMIILTFTIITTQFYDWQFLIRLVKNQQSLNLLVPNLEQFKKYFGHKCIQTTFHQDFHVQKLIGQGSFANVYLATRNFTCVEYAVKAFNKGSLERQIKGKEGLMNEIRVMRKLNQENLLQLYEVHETKHSIYLIMGMVKGGELFQRAKDIIYEGAKLQQLMQNLLSALNFMHLKGCMHRDIKPQNILLKSKENDTDIVIGDFGLATFVQERPLFKRCGTPDMQLQKSFHIKKEINFITKNVIYLALAGRAPFERKDFSSTAYKNNQDFRINFNVEEINKAPRSLLDLMIKMLEQNPRKRLSAQGCLQHQYFKEKFEQQQIEEKSHKVKLIFIASINEQQVQHIYEITQMDSFQLVIQEQQWDGNIDTLGSFSNSSQNNSKNRSEKQQINPSQFSQYGQQMEILQKGESPIIRKKNNDSLRKVALKNAFQQKMLSKDDQYIIDDQDLETGLEKKIQKLNKQSPKEGFLKKSTSLNI